MIIFHVLLHSM